MDDKYVGLEGCEDLWELLRSIHQTQESLVDWLKYFKESPRANNDSIIECEQAISATEHLFGFVQKIYTRMFLDL